MTLYFLTYRDEAAPDGFVRWFFWSQKKRAAGLASLKRGYAEDVAEAKKREEAGEIYPAYPTYSVDDVDLEELELSGTPKQMIMQALERFFG